MVTGTPRNFEQQVVTSGNQNFRKPVATSGSANWYKQLDFYGAGTGNTVTDITVAAGGTLAVT